MRTFLIGRSHYAEIVLADRSVAPRHAELTLAADGRGFLVDAHSPGGTWRREPGGSWQPVRQIFLEEGWELRFGEVEMPVLALMARVRGVAPAGGAGYGSGGGPLPAPQPGAGAATPGGASAAEPDDRPRGRVERDPETGEIVRKALS